MTDRMSTARWTGFFYLGLAVMGVVGFLFVREALFVPDDSAATLANLTDHSSLARVGIAVDLSVVLFQALAALWFFKLFRKSSSFAAGSIAAFGLVNAGTILIATAFSATALVVAGEPALAPSGDQAATVQLLYVINEHLWSLGGLFFGLWLIPMGYVVVKYKAMPTALGWLLIVGGVGYVVATYLAHIAPNAPEAIDALLIMVATVGELWTVGYLLVLGVRDTGQTMETDSVTS